MDLVPGVPQTASEILVGKAEVRSHGEGPLAVHRGFGLVSNVRESFVCRASMPDATRHRHATRTDLSNEGPQSATPPFALIKMIEMLMER